MHFCSTENMKDTFNLNVFQDIFAKTSFPLISKPERFGEMKHQERILVFYLMKIQYLETEDVIY